MTAASVTNKPEISLWPTAINQTYTSIGPHTDVSACFDSLRCYQLQTSSVLNASKPDKLLLGKFFVFWVLSCLFNADIYFVRRVNLGLFHVPAPHLEICLSLFLQILLKAILALTAPQKTCLFKALIICWLTSCNSMVYGIPKSLLRDCDLRTKPRATLLTSLLIPVQTKNWDTNSDLKDWELEAFGQGLRFPDRGETCKIISTSLSRHFTLLGCKVLC